MTDTPDTVSAVDPALTRYAHSFLEDINAFMTQVHYRGVLTCDPGSDLFTFAIQEDHRIADQHPGETGLWTRESITCTPYRVDQAPVTFASVLAENPEADRAQIQAHWDEEKRLYGDDYPLFLFDGPVATVLRPRQGLDATFRLENGHTVDAGFRDAGEFIACVLMSGKTHGNTPT